MTLDRLHSSQWPDGLEANAHCDGCYNESGFWESRDFSFEDR
jgi:hypothetical protein